MAEESDEDNRFHCSRASGGSGGSREEPQERQHKDDGNKGSSGGGAGSGQATLQHGRRARGGAPAGAKKIKTERLSFAEMAGS